MKESGDVGTQKLNKNSNTTRKNDRRHTSETMKEEKVKKIQEREEIIIMINNILMRTYILVVETNESKMTNKRKHRQRHTRLRSMNFYR